VASKNMRTGLLWTEREEREDEGEGLNECGKWANVGDQRMCAVECKPGVNRGASVYNLRV
jgi:hypothetical protein